MPCGDNAAADEWFSLICRLWYLDRRLGLGLGLSLDDVAMKHGDHRSATRELCRILKSLTPEQIEAVVYDAHDRESRALADWWEEHQKLEEGL